MFYKMITKKRDEWYATGSSVQSIIDYIESKNQMRDAQIDAIKTYLFLKIACDNRPLAELFSAGAFNTLDLDAIELSAISRNILQNDKALAALYEYASLKDDEGNQISKNICDEIKKNTGNINAREFFRKVFYGVTYTDYLFSLPMGAGKTYLMAAFIYLDLYFALNEPDNKAFAHNFIVLAPSGLKSSVIPSLKTIQNFDPSWVIPEPSAGELKRRLIFEVLDENKTAKKSNKIKNPNSQKLAIHQPFNSLFGLVAVTNAEKVILNRIVEKKGQISFYSKDEFDKDDMAANELRNIIGTIPSLSVFIDEVHHAATEEIKLRAVINKWTETENITSVVGFSGTPYLQTKERVEVTNKLLLSTQEISNIVYYYPLVNGIGNFLKKPIVYISDQNNRLHIIESGVRRFLDDYKDKIYPDGTCAKLGIYCGNSIELLESQVYPLVEGIVSEYGLNPASAILKFHGGNKQYPVPMDSAYEFASLDKPFSTKKIILLVQIGKEGWDCRSLTGIILSQEGDCPTNMVLQTSCRCLRQVEKDVVESALIYLNESNAITLNMQLEQQHRISLEEFQSGGHSELTIIKRYDRTTRLKLPKVDFYQLKINYKMVTAESATPGSIIAEIENAADTAKKVSIIKTAEFSDDLKTTNTEIDKAEHGDAIANFNIWLNTLLKESFGFIKYCDIQPYITQLKEQFDKVIYKKDGIEYFSSFYDIPLFNSVIRKAFYDKRSFETIEELIPEDASLLRIEKFKTEVTTAHKDSYYPDAKMVENIIADDNGKLTLDKKTRQMLELAEATGNSEVINLITKQLSSHPMKDKSFHYIPYKTDSDFEQKFLAEVLTEDCIKSHDLEVYYNGDDTLTEFRIKCYENKNGKSNYIGMYTPDFLIIKRKEGKIYKTLIVETKGRIYANDPTFQSKRKFTQTEFLQINNNKFGYRRFEYLYLEDSLTEKDRIVQTANAVERFFTEE